MTKRSFQILTLLPPGHPCFTNNYQFTINIYKHSFCKFSASWQFRSNVKATMNVTWVVIVIVFFLLDKGHEAENLQKECLFLLHYHFQ